MPVVTLNIDSKKVEVEQGTSILEAAKKAGVKVPSLCYLKDTNVVGVCRVCVVEVKGAKTLVASCVTPVVEGMEVYTNTPRVRNARRLAVELILSDHPLECPTCIRNLNCALQKLAGELGIRSVRFQGERAKYLADTSSPSVIRDPQKCILCRRCVSVCEHVQSVKAIGPQERGFKSLISPAFNAGLADTECVNCGQCSLVCPTGAIYEKDDTDIVWAALADPTKHVVVQTAPAVRVTLGEMFGVEPGSIVTGQMVAALKKLGFDRVFDTDFTADLTIMEEGSELIERIKSGGTLPLITSCSPGWIKFIEHFYPNLLSHLSTCKSPQQMFGALVKTYYAQKTGLDPANILSVSIMPCTAKKYEAQRPEMNSSGYRDVDVVLTTRELGRMLKLAGIDFSSCLEENYNEPFGISTGAAVIFGATGGVMEAALRTAYELISGNTLPAVEFKAVRGLAGVKEASVTIDSLKLNVAVAHGLGNARKLLDSIVAGDSDYHFVEIMCCPGGCIGGGGQPIPTDLETRAKRISGTYTADEKMTVRKSHQNTAVQLLYKEFLGQPLGHKSHQLLHTQYLARGKFKDI